MRKLTKMLLEREAMYDELIALVDSDERAAQILDDITYVIAGVLNGGLSHIAESDTYYQYYLDTLNYFRNPPEGPISEFISRLARARRAIGRHRAEVKNNKYVDHEVEGFTEACDEVEDWLYNKNNCEALSVALINYVKQDQ
jgi:hypothetical protein